MKSIKWFFVLFFMLWLVFPALTMGKGYMGGKGTVAVEEPAADAEDDDGGVPDTVEGPLNDKTSDAGKLFGDLYTILRQEGGGGDQKLVPKVDVNGEPVLNTGGFQDLVVITTGIIGGEPVLTVIDPGETNKYSDYGYYADETFPGDDDTPIYVVAQSPYPAQCVQPVASYERWGDISSKTGLKRNRLPLTISYDPTWGRSECEVGNLDGDVTVNAVSGELSIPVNQWFVEPCLDEDGLDINGADCKWEDPINGIVTYPDGVLWTDLIGEVHFGRLNLSRAPEAVLQAAFDEAINNINSPDTTEITIDASGRLLLTKNVYDEILVAGDTGAPLPLGTIEKAIDSPLENLALYVKLMKDGHLVTPGDERMPIDRSENGGMPLYKMLETTDGPGAKALRPTIDIGKMVLKGLDSLVDVSVEDYLTYYRCLDANGVEVACLLLDQDPVQPEYDEKLVGNPAVVSRELVTVFESAGCPAQFDDNNPYVCEGPFTGIMTDDGGTADGADLNFAASLLSAAGDKTGDISVDMVVYLNSILGINKVLGYSAYTDDGTPAAGAINYEENPEYFNFSSLYNYNRGNTFGSRGEGGFVIVLEDQGGGSWYEESVAISSAEMGGFTIFDNIGLDLATGVPNGIQATSNIRGFTQQADDDLGVISFIHTYQIPGLR